jgi:TolA-binding protein
MPIYTDDPGQGINQPLSNVPSGLGESLLASLKQGFEEGPVMSGIRFAQADMRANDPNSTVISKSDADARLKEYGVKSINIPDSGVTQSFLDHVIDERKASLAKQQIAMAAPSGWVATPLNFAASLAGSMADPGNVALAFVPFAGEAKAATVAGRFAERFVAGSKMGAAQALATVPLTAQAAAAEGDDFTYGNALESTFFNTMAGGLMHAGGGLIADTVRSRRTATTPEATATDISQPAPIDIPEAGTNADLATAISRDAESYAYSRAYDDVVPDYLARQQEMQSGFADNVGDLRSELVANNRGIASLDGSLQQRTSEYQAQRMKLKDARAKALKDIQAEKDAIAARNEEINQTIQRNAEAEQGRARESQLSRGEIPEDLKATIAERAQQIRDGMQMSPVAGAVRTAASTVRDADWSVNQQAYRAALAHMMDGRSPDVQPFYDLHTPSLRERAISRIQNPEPVPDDGGRAVSERADRVWQDTQKPGHEMDNAAADLENELNLSDALLNDIATDNPELAAMMRENIATIRTEANDESFGKALRAFAACMINRGL